MELNLANVFKSLKAYAEGSPKVIDPAPRGHLYFWKPYGQLYFASHRENCTDPLSHESCEVFCDLGIYETMEEAFTASCWYAFWLEAEAKAGRTY